MRVSLVVLFAVGLLGCGAYQNVTGYFNTFYNASRLYDDAVADVAKAPQPARDSNYFAPPVVSPAAAQKFDKVIEKCSKLIQFYPQSTWVEEAILLIGKSYIHTADYEPSFRKFKELLDNFPAGDSRFEAKLWFAKGKYSAKNQDEALALAKELFPEARAEGKDEIMLEALMLEAQIYVDRREYDQAAATYALAVEVSGDGAKRSFSQFQLGLCFEKLSEFGKAADAYARVGEFGPSFALEFKSRLKHGMMLSEMGRHEDAIASFEDLLGEQLKAEELAITDLEIANAYWALGDSAEAFSLYEFIDTTYRRSDAAARSYYRRGTIYEEHYADFRRAQEYFAKAKSENAQSEVAPLAGAKAENFNSYFTISRNLRNYDSLMARALLPDSVLARMDSIARASDTTFAKKPPTDAGADSALAKAEDEREPGDETEPAEDAPGAVVPVPPALAPPAPLAERPRARAGKDDMKSRRAHLDDTFEDDSDVPFAKLASAKGDSAKKSIASVKAPAAAKLTPDSLRTLIARSRFELASLFYLQMGYPDSALHYYTKMVTDHPASALTPKALYAMAEVYRAKGDTLMVDTLYGRILREHDGSEYASQVKRVLGIVQEDAPDDPALVTYEQAESLLAAGHPTRALGMLKSIAGHPSSLLVPKATYSVGWIYENVLHDADSATAWYRTLLSSYPSSAYALDAAPRVAVKDDSTSLEKYVKFKRIDAVPKPPKPNFGRRNIPVERTRLPGEENDRGIRDPNDEEADPDEEEPEEEDPEPEDPDDEGGEL